MNIGEGERLVQITATIVVEADSEREAGEIAALAINERLKGLKVVMSTVYVMNGSLADSPYPS